MNGWIKLHRKFLSWEWYDRSEMVHLFIHLLLSANSHDGKWRGIDIKRGQLITGLHSLSEQTHISIRKLRTCLVRLQETGEIDKQATNQFSIITVCNYESYQELKQVSDKQTGKRATSKRQASDNKQEYKKNKEEKEIYKGETSSPDFIERIINLFKEKYKTCRGMEYEITNIGKERSAAGKIARIYKKHYPDANTEQTLNGLAAYFERCVDINDDWLFKNMGLPIIINKFNEINTILKHGNKRVKQGATDAELAELFARKWGIGTTGNQS